MGFITNFIAIKLLFRPRKKFLGIQGLLPKRKDTIAQRAGAIVNDYLVNGEDLRLRMDRQRLERAVDSYLEHNGGKLWELPLMKGLVKRIVTAMLIDKDGYFNRKVIESIIDEGMVSGIVEQKIREFDVTALEALVKKAGGPELRFIILSGAMLGFIIGLAEAFIGF